MSPRIGAIGCGHWGRNIVRDLVALGAEVHVADSSVDARARAESLGAAVVATIDELPPCRGYVVATPAETHHDVVRHLVSTTPVPIFVEKPPCDGLHAVRALAADGADRLFVMHKWRYHSGVRALRDLARDGAVGTPLRLETTRTGPEALPPGIDVTWHLAVHDLSIALEILGSVPEAREADGGSTDEGRIGWCEATLATGAGVEHRLTVAAGQADRRRDVRLVGSEGSVLLADARDDHVEIERAGRREKHPIADAMPLECELRVFLAYLDGGPAPRSTIGEALAVCEQVARIDALVRGSA